MLKEKILAALNKQLNEELYSSYVYLAMSAYFDLESFSGFSHWMRLQSNEEYGHALKIFDYILQRDSKVKMLQVTAPKGGWKSHLEVFEDTYKQEKNVSKSINDLVELALNEKDYATNNFMQWFVSEQVEEESTALKILEKLKLIGDNKNGLLILDRELGLRATSAS